YHPYAMGTKWCAGCKSVSYCSVECQKQDWKRVHREECKLLAAQRKSAWFPDGLIQARADVTRYGPGENPYTERRAEQHPTLPRADVISVYGSAWGCYSQDPCLTIAQYRELAENFHPWSSRRFHSIVSTVHEQRDLELMSFVFPFGSLRLHLLCLVR